MDGKDNTKADQSDVVAQNAKLTADLASITAEAVALRTQVSALTGENTTLKAEKATLQTNLTAANANLSTVTSERDTLKTENAKLVSEKTTFEAAVAARVSALGITDNGRAGATGAAAGGDKKASLTEQVLQARGCKSLDELHTKMEKARAEQAAIS
jgi:regulator of replication initiation timing